MLHLGAQFRRDPLIGVERQHPIAARQIQRTIFLRTKARPVITGRDLCLQLARDIGRAVGTGRIEHDDFIGPRHGLQAARDDARLVFGDYDHAQSHATCSVVWAGGLSPANSKPVAHAKKRPSVWSSNSELNMHPMTNINTSPRARSR